MKNFITLITILSVHLNFLAQTTHTINAGSYYYNPSSLTIDIGDSVVWINDGGFHDVNGDINSVTGQPYNNPETFDSPSTNVTGAVIFSYKFTVAGTYNYDCSVGSHAANGMIGTVIVEDNNTSIDELFSSFSFVTHNKNSNTINLNFIISENEASVALYNIEGKLIQANNIITKTGENNHILHLNKPLGKGIYIVSLNHGQQKTTKKLIVK
ncbi:MAG: hypothetical protein CL846_03630 [Crocinitomicaceae bacterium]|nr:hypothetical protein [Crocinitomicaceae bacterium]|tara:strand:+ start:3066 stop:3701 length:636 start_codon:yes stop_codon:yes gene_type:complete